MVYTKDNKEIKNHSRKNLHKIRHKKTKVKKNKSRKHKSNKTRKAKFARGKRYCDYEIEIVGILLTDILVDIKLIKHLVLHVAMKYVHM